MSPERFEAYLQELEPPSTLDGEAQGRWRAEARQQLMALAAAYEEMGHVPEEALQAALRQLRAMPRSPARRDHFPMFRAAGRRARVFGRRLVPVAAGALLLVILGSVVANEIAGRALERELTAVRAQGQPLTLREAAPLEVPDAENAAVVYAEAFQQLARAEPVALPSGQHRMSAEQEQALRDILSAGDKTPRAAATAAIRKLLAETEPALERSRVAAAMPRCRFPVNWEDGFGALLPHLPQINLLSRLLAAHAITAAEDGRAAEAVVDVASIVRMARHLSGEPTLVGQLIQYACLGNAQHALERLMESASLTEAQSREFSEALAGLDVYGSFGRALQSERCLGLWGFDFARRDPGKLAQLTGPESEPVLLVIPRLWLVGKPLLKMDEVVYLRLMGREVALAGLRRRIAPDEWDEARMRLPWYAVMSRFFVPALGRASDRRDITVARIGLAQWALVLHVYQQRTGHYPAAAEAAARSVGWALPQDPFSGGAFHYRRQGDGYLLYSFGANGRDDGGRNAGGRTRELSGTAPVATRQEDDIAWRTGG
jgi:hypothetical protein